jgi:long-chain fatty acid transport protein
MDLVADLNADGIKDIDFKDGSDFTGAAKGYSGGQARLHLQAQRCPDRRRRLQTAANLPDLKDDDYKVTGFDMPACSASVLPGR